MWGEFPAASWRGLTPIDPVTGRALLSFVVESRVQRLRVDVESMRELSAALAEAFAPDPSEAGYVVRRTTGHSPMSSGRPQVDGSIPDDGKKT